MIPRSKGRQSGFTLIEMLIVVAVIAALVAIAIPVFNDMLDQTRQATDKANCRSAESLAIADCYANQGGNLGARSEAEWVAFVEASGIPASSQADASNTLRCTVETDSISFSYGAGGGTTPSADGSVTVTDSTGQAHRVEVSTDWASLRQNGQYGINLTQGLVLSDNTGTYVLGWGGYASGDVRNKTLADVQTSQPDLLFRITSSTKIWVAADKVTLSNNQGTVWPSAPSGGDLCYLSGSYYLAPSTLSVYTFPPSGWVSIAQ